MRIKYVLGSNIKTKLIFKQVKSMCIELAGLVESEIPDTIKDKVDIRFIFSHLDDMIIKLMIYSEKNNDELVISCITK